MPTAQLRPPHLIGKTLSKILISYYLGPDHPSKLRIWNLLNRWFGYPRLTIPHGPHGLISIDLRSVLEFWLLRDRYNYDVWACLSKVAKKDEVLWDIGGHVGMVAILAMQDPKVREVHCFEPHPEIFLALKANLALNPNYFGKAYAFGLGDRSEMQTLHEGHSINNGLGSFLPTGTNTPRHSVQVRTVDELIAEGVTPPTLIKLDVEGWEIKVLQGARKLFSTRPPRAILFEDECDSTGNISDPSIPNFLKEFGYSYTVLPTATGTFSARENYLAIRPE